MALSISVEDGNPVTTTIVDSQTGEDLTRRLAITAVDVRIRTGELVSASLVVELLRADVDAKTVRWMTKNPVTGTFDEVASIIFADGTRYDF